MANVAYLVWVESLNSPILKGQVLNLLKIISTFMPMQKIYIINFIPFYKLFLDRKQLSLTIKDLKKQGIQLVFIPVLYPGRWFNAKWYQIPLILVQAYPVLLFFVLFKKISIYHCRSYPIVLPALAVKVLFSKLKIIFDPRSDFPGENIVLGRWNSNSISYRLWKIFEKWYLNYSDVVVAITKTYVTHYKSISSNSNFVIIPNNVNLKRFEVSKDFRKEFRRKHGISEDEIIFCYCGSMGDKYWNDIKIYAKCIEEFRILETPHRFLFITPNVNLLKQIFLQLNINKNEFIVVSASFEDVPLYLSIADFGLQMMGRYDIRMGIKTAEYLAMGLPIIVNNNVAGAKEIVEDFDVGLVYELGSNDVQILSYLIRNRLLIQKKCIELARNMFSDEVVARQYKNLYRSIA